METIKSKRENLRVYPIFARHETFHPRFGWLKKGFDKASENREIFTDEQAPAVLGVGKNMVRAIRYWCWAYKVLDEVHEKNAKRTLLVTSEFGNKLLNEKGWDPYLEDLASLWLLHWNLLKLPCYATAWYFTFNIFNKNTFSTDDILYGLLDYKDREFPTNKIIESSLSHDVNCLLRMYVEQRSQKVLKEDSINSPFTELRLIKQFGDAKHFAMNIGAKTGLVPEIIVTACLEYADTSVAGAKTISISRLMYDQGSPGLCFKLTESVLCDAIEYIARQYDEVSLSETAGLIQFSYTGNPLTLAGKILHHYYGKRRN